jgi:NAD(P)-dependent dehydrogenase (short-subunit alcohol dehydrogenase family)
MSFFSGKVVLVTGAGSGLGREMAIALAREGAAVAAIDIQAQSLASLRSEIPESCRFASAVADVCDRAALPTALAPLTARLGAIDIAIANAGIGFETSALAFQAEDIERHVQVNLIGVANTMAAVLPGMLERQQGHLVAISSVASFRGLPRMLGYCASKAGVNALMEGLRVELAPRGIRVTTVCPGWIRTPLTADLEVPPSELMEADEAARCILDAIRRGKAFLVFPRRTAWQARLLTYLPRRLSDRIVARLMQKYGPRESGRSRSHSEPNGGMKKS